MAVAILLVALILRRFALRSWGLAMLCLGATEITVFLIIMLCAGRVDLTMVAIGGSLKMFYRITWNVVAAFLVGAWLGHLWARAANVK